MESEIVIRGAREHNLRDVSLKLPRNSLVVMSGVSGSGKSSLAFDTLYAEGQRRYVESLSSYARQFLGQMPKPDVDSISGLSPSISIQQKTSGRNPRSTVGTITEIYDYLRVLYARVGDGCCPQCHQPITAQSQDQILDTVSRLPEGTRFTVLAPLIQRQKGEYRDLFEDLLKQGFLRARVDGRIVQLTDAPTLDKQMRHTIDVIIDRLKMGPGIRTRLSEAVEVGLRMGQGSLIISQAEAESPVTGMPESDASESDHPAEDHPAAEPHAHDNDRLFSSRYACTTCGISYEPPSPQLFSFNSPQGMCPDCQGLGQRHDFDLDKLIPDPTKSFAKGAIELIGQWSDFGRWRKKIFQAAAKVIGQKCKLPEDAVLKRPWESLPESAREMFLRGINEPLVINWSRPGGGTWKQQMAFSGLLTDLLAEYGQARNPMRRKQLEKYLQVGRCHSCDETRLNRQARAVRLTSLAPRPAPETDRSAGQSSQRAAVASAVRKTTRKTKSKSSPESATPHSAGTANRWSLGLPEVCSLTIADAVRFFEQLDLNETRQLIASELLKEIRGRLGFLLKCGLDYLTLNRSAPTLSGGETQRIRLAGQIGCGLVGVVYILDEPSIGLHPRDNEKLLGSLLDLRDLGNTVIVVEHDEDTMRAADQIIDFGPGPGVRGGEIVAQGTVEEIRNSARSITGQYLSGRLAIEIPSERKPPGEKQILLTGARHNNLRNVDVEFPLERFLCVTGVSGSGKSSLVNDILWEALRRDLNGGDGQPGDFDSISGLEHLDKAIDIDQSPIGRTPRSNPATYIGLFDLIRDLFAQLPESKLRGYKPGRFSFNVSGGRCEACEGHGANKLEMDFLADVWVTCPVCNGARFNHGTLEVRFKDKSISEVLNMDVQEALQLFENQPRIVELLKTLDAVGLDYLKLGQPSPTLSGGEAQRIKLARELGRRSTGRTIYLLDEPTTGLHFADIHKLLDVLHGLVKQGNTVLVVEHNLDVIKTADWVIDLGPEGGSGGGRILVAGTPEAVMAHPESYTGQALARSLMNAPGGGAISAETGSDRRGSKTGGKAAGKAASKASAAARKSAPVVRGVARSNAPAEGKSLLAGEPAAPLSRSREVIARPIIIQGAQQHNLQHVHLELPRHQMSVFCGPSGSGKTSLAMDTLYAEGQRRYVESLSSYARQFLGQMPKPKVESVSGLSPAIAIEQKTVGHTPRSTVGTVTEIYDYLRILFARLGVAYCPHCDLPVRTQSPDEVIEQVLKQPAGTRLLILSPVEVQVGQSYDTIWSRIAEQGYRRVRIDGVSYRLEEVPEIDRRAKHDVEIIVDRVTLAAKDRGRLQESIETALDLGKGWLRTARIDEAVPEVEWKTDLYSLHKACLSCGRSFEELTPHSFSFNSPLGWCHACEGLGIQQGTNLAALIHDAKRSLAGGAISVWPRFDQNPQFRRIVEAVCRQFQIPLDQPFDRLDPKQQRLILYGTGDKWITVNERGLSVQYKGLYPAVEEATRVSIAHRMQLDHLVGEVACSACHGSRVRDDSAAVRLWERTLFQLCDLPLSEALTFFREIRLNSAEKKIAGDLLDELTSRLSFLVDVGLDYLTLGRTMPTLSGGESQRIRLAGQIGRALTGVLYVLDEPTIGLHPRDNTRLLGALKSLRDLGNTVVLVEHDREVLDASDRLYDFGPGAGRYGGNIVGEGSPSELRSQPASLTGQYLAGTASIPVPKTRRLISRADFEISQTENADQSDRLAGDAVPGDDSAGDASSGNGSTAKRQPSKSRSKLQTGVASVKKKTSAGTGPVHKSYFDAIQPPGGGWLELIGARHHNLRDVDLRIPLGALTCITGVSGSGKSSLVEETLAKALARQLHRARETPGPFDRIEGLKRVDKVIQVDQQPLGSTPASNPATYTGVFELIRDLFARLPEAKLRGYGPGRFSFNRPGGRCEACEGNGQQRIEMHFLADVWIECEVCHGRRFNEETLTVQYRGQSIADVLSMPVGKAVELFDKVPAIRGILSTLAAVGLDYLTLGQSAATLSGGEAQRVKLASELARPQTGRTMYILDEPTTGLHFDDIRKLLKVLDSLVELGNTVVVIEHNLDVIKTADWIVDLGPEAGREGGWIVAEGTPEDLVRHAQLWQQEQTVAKKPATGAIRADRSPKSGAAVNTAPAVPSGRMRSWTGELLEPILAAAPREERELFDARAASEKREGDLSWRELSEGAKMPWQTDGRKWHLVERRARNGRPVRWDAEVLSTVIDRIEQDERFAPINWNHRSVIEVAGKQSTLGWFLHAVTGDEWMCQLKFRVPRDTFEESQLEADLKLKPVSQIDELPISTVLDRVSVKRGKGPWQEIGLTLYRAEEVGRPAFQNFLQRALQAYLSTEPFDATSTMTKKELLLAKIKELTEQGKIGPRKIRR